MTTAPATAASDQAVVFQQVARIMFNDLRAYLDRAQALMAEAGTVTPPLSDLVARRVRHVRDFVDALGNAVWPRVPYLSAEVHTAFGHALDKIDQRVKTHPADACERAIRLVELIGREVSWLTHA
jgi:hypothetical protein